MKLLPWAGTRKSNELGRIVMRAVGSGALHRRGLLGTFQVDGLLEIELLRATSVSSGLDENPSSASLGRVPERKDRFDDKTDSFWPKRGNKDAIYPGPLPDFGLARPKEDFCLSFAWIRALDKSTPFGGRFVHRPQSRFASDCLYPQARRTRRHRGSRKGTSML